MTLEIDGLDHLEPIGRGGSSDVYRAHDVASGRTVAVKVYRFDGTTESSARLFLRESRAADALSTHPNIATIDRAAISEQGQPYVVLEYADGSLADLIRSGPIPIDRAVELATGIVEGLRAAHEQGVLHRDVKPANVLIGYDGRAMLADFGIASVLGGAITTTGSNPYTLAYAPPEVLRGQPADERSDVYAVGATLYEMLEGRPPFAAMGLTQIEILGRALNDPAPTISRSDISPGLRDLVASMLDVDPTARPTLEQVAARLDPEHAGSDTSNGSRRARTPLKVGAILSGVVVLAVVAIAVALLINASGDDSDATIETGDSAPSTTIAEDTTVPTEPAYVPETDESPALAAAAAPLVDAATKVIAAPATKQDVSIGNYFPVASGFPAIESLPSTEFWRFASDPVQERGCREYFPPGLTITGFSSTLQQAEDVTVWTAVYALDEADAATQMFQGRTIGIGVTPQTCEVVGADVHLSQFGAPLDGAPQNGTPEWADQLSSWTLGPALLLPTDRTGYGYVMRRGRRIWEVRVSERGDRQVTSAELTALVDAAGAAAINTP